MPGRHIGLVFLWREHLLLEHLRPPLRFLIKKPEFIAVLLLAMLFTPSALIDLLLQLAPFLLAHESFELLHLVLRVHLLAKLLAVGGALLQLNVPLIVEDGPVLSLDARIFLLLALPLVCAHTLHLGHVDLVVRGYFLSLPFFALP